MHAQSHVGSPPRALWERMVAGPLPLREVLIALFLIGLLSAAVATGWIKGSGEEVLGLCTGLCSVWLALREHPLTWLATLINTVAFAVIFFAAGAYGNFALQGLQFALCMYGWLHWVRGKETGDAQVPIGRANRFEWALVAAMAAAIAGALVFTRGIDTLDLAAVDAVSSAFGFGALFLQARKRVECWPAWIVAMALMAPILVADGSMVMMAFVPLGIGACLLAWISWSRSAAARSST
jgi:nicotinamide mononucleotide transporter